MIIVGAPNVIGIALPHRARHGVVVDEFDPVRANQDVVKSLAVESDGFLGVEKGDRRRSRAIVSAAQVSLLSPRAKGGRKFIRQRLVLPLEMLGDRWAFALGKFIPNQRRLTLLSDEVGDPGMRASPDAVEVFAISGDKN